MTGARSSEMTSGIGETVAAAVTLEAFVAVHYDRLIRLAGIVCGDPASSQDIVQSALERAWRSRDGMRDPARLQPWLDRIVVREAARERRTRLTWIGRMVRQPAVTEIEVPGSELVDRATSGFPERAAIRIAFDRLSRAQRAVVALTLHAGYSIDETAAMLGIPRDTVRSRMRSARERLRAELGEVR